jgi:MFS superfamily sulfate permease-like transporter
MKNHQETLLPPKDGLEGLKQNFSQDATSGFVVFLLALPLSLGIAAASGFPPIMGVLTAIIGGLVATFFTGSQLSIKGPAAGLIVIVADCVGAFGGGMEGWRLALGVMVVAGVIQILMGVFKWGKFVDIFPLSAVHGMLAAIGFIIIAKQVPVLLNVDPSLASGKAPFELFAAIPSFFANLDPQVSIIGGVSLAIMLGWGFVKHPFLKQIPAPLLVLIFAIPASLMMNLCESAPDYTLVKVGKIIDQVGINATMEGFSQTGIFIKFVIMVSLVGTLESLLTVKAIDMLDPWKRKADPNKDIVAIGISNSVAGLLGGLPMISEVARSSANVAQGARTRWANFFHGLFLLLSVLLAFQLLELIPNAALAAMLIAVGIKLAHPKEFTHMLKVGPEQLAIFVTTIVFTLAKDLLVGIATGMILKAIIHVSRGASLGSLFRAGVVVDEENERYLLRLGDAAIFTNYLGIKEKLDKIPKGKTVAFDLANTVVIDHTVMDNLHHFEEDYVRAGGTVEFIGLDELEPVSSHPHAARKRSKNPDKDQNN